MERYSHQRYGPSVRLMMVCLVTWLTDTQSTATELLSTTGHLHVQLVCPKGYLLFMATTVFNGGDSGEDSRSTESVGPILTTNLTAHVYIRCFGKRHCQLDLQQFTNASRLIHSVHMEGDGCMPEKYFYNCSGLLDDVDTGFIISNNFPMRSIQNCSIRINSNETTLTTYYGVATSTKCIARNSTKCVLKERHAYVIMYDNDILNITAAVFLLRISKSGIAWPRYKEVTKCYSYEKPRLCKDLMRTKPTGAPTNSSRWPMVAIGIALSVFAMVVVIATIIIIKRRKLHRTRQKPKLVQDTNTAVGNIYQIQDDQSEPTQTEHTVQRTTAKSTRAPAIPPDLVTGRYSNWKGTNQYEEIRLPSSNEADLINYDYEVQIVENDLYVQVTPDLHDRESAGIRIIENELYSSVSALEDR